MMNGRTAESSGAPGAGGAGATNATKEGIFWIVANGRAPTRWDTRDLPANAWIELRADLAPDPAPPADEPGRHWTHVYCLRSRDEGGGFTGSADERRARLIAAARPFDMVDLEVARDLHPDLLAAIPPERRVLSWSGAAVDRDALGRLHRRMIATPAALYRLTPQVRCATEALDVLRFLRQIDRTDTIAYADGPSGVWTRPLAPRYGAPFIVATLEGELAWTRLRQDYGLPALPPVDELYGIVGASVLRSMSPRLHNAGLRGMRRRALFVPFVQQDFEPFWRTFCIGDALSEIGLRLKGLTVGSPHKDGAAAVATSRAAIVCRTDSSNLLVRRRAGWFAGTTDPLSALPLLVDRGRQVRGRRVAVIGCGGSGRSIAAALARAGGRVTLVNRTRDRGERAAGRLGVPFVPLAAFTPRGFAIVVNATPVGRDSRDVPFEPRDLDRAAIVVDLVCVEAAATALVEAARAANLVTIDGHQVLAAQVSRQFRAMTGADLPGDRRRTLPLVDPAAPSARRHDGVRIHAVP